MIEPLKSDQLHLGDAKGRRFLLPLDVATETVAIIARKGAGKTYTGRVLVEGLTSAHIPVVVIDPLDVWWGLRVAADGKGKGQNVVIFGGAHADLPLLETTGRDIADLIVERGLSAVLVLDHLSQGGQRRFVAEFAEQLFQRKAEQAHRTALHLVIDEADAFAPQKPTPDGLRCLGAIDRLVRRGRSRGIGTTCITQRPAVLAKDVLTQTEILITLQVTAPQDRKALEEWVRGNAEDREQATAYLNSLGSLQRGEAWVWSPSRLKVFEQVRIRTATTYDSSYTPKVGETRPPAPTLRPVELAEISAALAAVVEEAKANDPKALKARIKELEARTPEALTIDQMMSRTAEYRALEIEKAKRDRDLAWRGHIMQEAQSFFREISGTDRDDQIDATGSGLVQPTLSGAEIQVALNTSVGLIDRSLRDFGMLKLVDDSPATQRPDVCNVNGKKMGKCENALIRALAQLNKQRNAPSSRAQIAIVSGYSINSSTFANGMSALRVAGCISGSGDEILITRAGLTMAGTVPPMPSGMERVKWWMGRLSLAERQMLLVLAKSHPKALDKIQISNATGYSKDSSTFANALSKLRVLGLITRDADPRASDELMGAG